MPLALFFFILFIYFWLRWVLVAAAACGLSLVVARRGCSLVVVRRLFIVIASLVVKHGL